MRVDEEVDDRKRQKIEKNEHRNSRKICLKIKALKKRKKEKEKDNSLVETL